MNKDKSKPKFNFLISKFCKYEISFQKMSTEKIKIILCFYLLLLLSISLFFPAHLEEYENYIYQIGNAIPSIHSLLKISNFPAALVVTNLAAIFFGFLFALIVSVSPITLKAAEAMRLTKGRRGVLPCVLSGIVFPYLVLTTHIQVRQDTGSDAFFLSVSNSRAFLAIWAGGVFFLLFSSLAGMAVAFIVIFSKDKK